ncbi:MAG: hypothetical protein KF745_02245 [Phycisphaeraceae bacterium]|nr:hypothetical protein [Phycisphaeraceae bacterium]
MSLASWLSMPIVPFLVAAAAVPAAFLAVRLLGLDRRWRRVLIRESIDLSATIDHLTLIARAAEKNGVSALQGHLERPADPFLANAISLVSRGATPAHLRAILEHDLDTRLARHAGINRWLAVAGRVLPAIGVCGVALAITLLVSWSSSPSGVTTLHASSVLVIVFFSLLVLGVRVPDADSLAHTEAQRALAHTLVVAAMTGIASGEHSVALNQRLRAMLTPTPPRPADAVAA